MTPGLSFHCSRMRADFLLAPCLGLAKSRGECEGCAEGKNAIKPPVAPRKWNIMPRQAPKVKKAATVMAALSVAKSEAKPERKCKNCGFHVGPQWAYCRPCTDARKKYADDPLAEIGRLREIRRARINGTIRKGRKPNDRGTHRGGKRKKEEKDD